MCAQCREDLKKYSERKASSQSARALRNEYEGLKSDVTAVFDKWDLFCESVRGHKPETLDVLAHKLRNAEKSLRSEIGEKFDRQTLLQQESWGRLCADVVAVRRAVETAIQTASDESMEKINRLPHPDSLGQVRKEADQDHFKRYKELHGQLQRCRRASDADEFRATLGKIGEAEGLAARLHDSTPPNVSTFLRDVQTPAGAELGRLTPEIQEWLASNKLPFSLRITAINKPKR
jgi:hypothetical protein